MKRLFIALSVTFFICSAAVAQSNKEDINIIQNVYGKQKKDIVADLVAIDPAVADQFWQMYDEYEHQRKAIGKTRIQLMEDYVVMYDKLSDQQADELTKAGFKTSMDLEKLHEKYYKKFAKIIGPLSAAKVMQIEDYLRTMVKLDVQDNLPFVNELNTQYMAKKR